MACVIDLIIQNVISQSIPHLHIHIVPRNKKDGLKGFFWPRQRYENENQMQETQDKIKFSRQYMRNFY